MSMDPWLARIYGTDGGEDLEKTAQYMLLEKLAAEEGIDLSQLPPEQVDALAQQVSQQMAGGQQQAPQQAGADQPDPQLVAMIEQLRAQGYPDDQIEAYLEQQFGGQEQQPDPAQAAQQGQPQQQPQVQQQAAPQGQGQPSGPLGAMLAGMQRQQAPAQQAQPQLQMPQQQGQQPGVSEALQKEAQAKFEEADFLGRVMAHSYYQELREIAANEGQVKTASARELMERGMSGARSVVGKAMDHVKANKGAYGAGAAGVGGAAAGFAAGRATAKTKTAGAAAVEALAHARALEILRANGYTITE